MSLKCSLLGHDFGESTVERDREEQGSEVVITIEEVQTCQRCGETRVVSENKEVTSLEMPEDIDGESEAAPEQNNASESVHNSPESVDQSETVTEAESAEADTPQADASTEVVETETEPVESESEPPVTDDAEILDEDDDIDRSPGEWPQEAEPTETHDEEDFDQYGYMDEGEDAVDDETTDAEFIDDEPVDTGDEPAVEETSAQTETNAWPSEDETTEPAEPTPPTGPGAVTVPDGDFVCRHCGFSTPVEESSLREGDFCPECHKETLVQVREE